MTKLVRRYPYIEAPAWLFIAALTLFGCSAPFRHYLLEPKAAVLIGIQIQQPSVTLKVGTQSQPLHARYTPINAGNVDAASLVWVVTDPGLATVDAQGRVTAGNTPVSNGLMLTVSVKDSTGQMFTSPPIPVTITLDTIAVDNVEVTPESVTLAEGGTVNLTADITPAGASDPSVTWASDDATGKITVSQAGVVSVDVGAPASAVITATANDGSGKQDSCVVFVGNPVTSIQLHQTSLGLAPGEQATLSATVTPPGGSIRWVLVAGNATVNAQTGQVTANGNGVSVVTAESLDGGVTASAECTVTVYDPNSTTTPVPKLGSGTVLGASTTQSGAVLAVDQADGTVYIAYADGAGVGYVKRAAFGSSNWIAVGGDFATGGAQNVVVSADRRHNLSLAVNQGTPYIAYIEGGGSFQFPFVKKFDGATNWINAGTGLISSGSGSYLSLAFDSSNEPFLGYADNNLNNKISISSLSGGVWGPLVPLAIGFSNPSSSYSAVAYDATHTLGGFGGNPTTSDYYIAYLNQGNASQIVNFFGVTPEGFANPGATSMSFTDMTIVNGNLYLAYKNGSNGRATLFLRTPAVFESHIMDLSGTGGSADFVSLAVDPRNGNAYIAYTDNLGFPKIAVLPGGAGVLDPGTVIVSLQDETVNAIDLAFYVDASGQGHLYACYGLNSGGVVVKDFLR